MNKMPYQDKKGRKYFYGDFLPIEHSPFGYNETAAQDWYPLTREAAIEGGYLWSDYQSDVKYEFSDYKIPDDIRDVKDDILDKFLKCEASGKAYRITPMELQFYRHVGIPIPLRWPLERHKARIARMLPRKLWRRKCQCAGATASNGSYKNTSQHQHGSNSCHNEFETSYAPDRKEIVYCEDCYKAEVI
jgi:hypothetical protein